MVGDPKNLSDLRRIEAQVRVTCRSCKATEVWELEALIAEVRSNGGSTDWRVARYSLKCPDRCASPLMTMVPIPYGRALARQQGHRHAVVSLALEILHAATARSARESVDTVEVRLALHVLRPYLGASSLLTAYWDAGTSMPRHPWSSCHAHYRVIVTRLIERGVTVSDRHRS